MGRPRDPSVSSELRWCDRCGAETEWRQHRVGFTAKGVQKWRWRCVDCRKLGPKLEDLDPDG